MNGLTIAVLILFITGCSKNNPLIENTKQNPISPPELLKPFVGENKKGFMGYFKGEKKEHIFICQFFSESKGMLLKYHAGRTSDGGFEMHGFPFEWTTEIGKPFQIKMIDSTDDEKNVFMGQARVYKEGEQTLLEIDFTETKVWDYLKVKNLKLIETESVLKDVDDPYGGTTLNLSLEFEDDGYDAFYDKLSQNPLLK